MFEASSEIINGPSLIMNMKLVAKCLFLVQKSYQYFTGYYQPYQPGFYSWVTQCKALDILTAFTFSQEVLPTHLILNPGSLSLEDFLLWACLIEEGS